MDNFCQFKVAYLLPVHSSLTGDIDDAFDIIDNDKLPGDWEMRETGISGAAGYILVFETFEIPQKKDLEAIDAYIKSFN